MLARAATPGWRWLLWAALCALALAQIAHTRVTADVTAFLPGPADARQRLLVDQLRDGASTRLVVVGLRLEGDGVPDAAASAALVDASQALRGRLARLETIAWASNGDPAWHAAERERVFGARYLLSPGVTAGSFSVDALRAAFERLQAELVSARGAAVRGIAAADPTLESLRLLAQASASLGVPRNAGDVWFGPDGRAALLVFETTAGGADVAAVDATIAQARAEARAVLRDWPAGVAPPVVEFAGAGYFNARSQQAIGGESVALVLLALALIASLLLWALRSPRVLPLALFPVASGAVAGFAAVGLAYDAVHATTIGFGVTLLGEAVDYVIYAFVQREDGGRPAPRFWSKLWLAVLTSMIGFAAMVLSGFQGLQQLGVFSIVGLGVAAVSTRFLVPALLDGTAPREPVGAAAALPGVARRATVLRWPVVGLVLLVLAWLHWRDAPLWQDGLDALSSASVEETARDLAWRTAIGQPDLRTVLVVHGDDLEQALQRVEAIRPALEARVAAGELARFSDPARWLPSRATQAARLAALPAPELLRERIETAVAGTKLRAAALEPFVAAVQATRERGPMTLADYDGTIIGSWLAGQIVRSADGVDVLVLLQRAASSPSTSTSSPATPAPVDVQTLVGTAGVPGVSMLDLQREVESLVAVYRHKALVTALAGAAGIVLILALRLRRAAAVASMVASLAATVVLTAGALVLGAGSLSVFHLVAMLLVVGVASNYTLFFASLPADCAQRRKVSLSVVLAAAATVIAFALLSWSSAPLLSMIGSTVALGAVLGLASALVFSREEAADAHTAPDAGGVSRD
ncbi:MAG: MMPL family transporter [Lautropia sp.]